DLVAGLLAEAAGEEAHGADEAALVEQLLEILGGRVVAIATAGLERLRHALEHLLPTRYADSRTDDERSFARPDLIDEGLGDRVLRHPKPPASCVGCADPSQGCPRRQHVSSSVTRCTTCTASSAELSWAVRRVALVVVAGC